MNGISLAEFLGRLNFMREEFLFESPMVFTVNTEANYPVRIVVSGWNRDMTYSDNYSEGHVVRIWPEWFEVTGVDIHRSVFGNIVELLVRRNENG